MKIIRHNRLLLAYLFQDQDKLEIAGLDLKSLK